MTHKNNHRNGSNGAHRPHGGSRLPPFLQREIPPTAHQSDDPSAILRGSQGSELPVHVGFDLGTRLAKASFVQGSDTPTPVRLSAATNLLPVAVELDAQAKPIRAGALRADNAIASALTFKFIEFPFHVVEVA